MCIFLVRDAPDWKYSQILSNIFSLQNMLSNIYQIVFGSVKELKESQCSFVRS